MASCAHFQGACMHLHSHVHLQLAKKLTRVDLRVSVLLTGRGCGTTTLEANRSSLAIEMAPALSTQLESGPAECSVFFFKQTPTSYLFLCLHVWNSAHPT
jgi:hypothetical protein